MVNRIPRIIKRSVDAIKPDGTDTVYWNGALTGFGLRVRRSGQKVYVVQARVDRKLRWYTISARGGERGSASGMSAGDPCACEEGHRTPGTRRSSARLSRADRKPSTQQEYGRSVKLFIDPVIGEMRVSEVRRRDIATLHHGLRDKPYQANRTLGVLSKLFNLAEVWGLAPGRLQHVPAREALQGVPARALPDRGRDRAAWRGSARGRRRDAVCGRRMSSETQRNSGIRRPPQRRGPQP